MDVTVLMLLLKLYLMSKVLLPLSGLHHCTDEVLPSQYTSHRILPIRSRLVSEQGKVFFATLGYASEVIIQDNKDGIGDDAVSSVIAGAVIYMPFAELVDIAKEKERLAKEEKRLNGEIKRCEGMLGNERFVSKAPEAKVQEEKDKLAKYQQMLEQVKEQIARIS